MMSHLKFYIKTHGCKTNQLESAVISEKLKAAGWMLAKGAEDADVYILNSCSVTGNADTEALRLLRHVKSKNPKIITVLTGCVAQLSFEELKKIEYVDLFLGNNDKFSIVDLINTRKSVVTDIFSVEKFNNQFVHDYSKTRGYIKIQDGCNNYCSYCTIPLARGKSRSNSVENIKKQLQIFVESGIKEVVLTGIHIGQWGSDFDDKKSLIDLLEVIESSGIHRYRLGSLNTLELTDDLLDFLVESEKFCPHFHLSLQSVNTKVLSAMNRHYSAESCVEIVEKINSMFDLPFIGSDVIVGFPGETDDDFLLTVKNLKSMELSSIHVFPYSVRKNTKAAAMSEQIEMNVKKSRAELLHSLADEKLYDFMNKNIGTTAEVLVEKRPDKKTGLLKGVTKNYLTVFLNTEDKKLCNTIQKVKIVKFEADRLFCNIMKG